MDDLISRQAAIDAMDDILSEVADGDGFQYEKWRRYFCELPSPDIDLSRYSKRLWHAAYERGKAEAKLEMTQHSSEDASFDAAFGRWVPVTERLPDDNKDILVTYVDGEEPRIIPVNYGRGTWYDCVFDRTLNPFKITAWMSIPEPWKGEADD